MKSTKITRPLLRYHGGKYLLAPWIISYFPAHQTYVEPFGGAASVLFRKQRAYAEIYNDLDQEIVSLFRVMRDPVQAKELIRLLELTPFARDEFELSYLPVDNPIEQARRTIARSFMGFGSTLTSSRSTGFRNNTTRSGSTPAQDWKNYPGTITAFIERLRGVVIENRPAIEVILNYDSPETLFYIDPPYPYETRGKWGGKAYKFEMADSDHRNLAEVLRSLRGMVILSGYPCELYDSDLYPNWKRITRETNADGARKRTEVLWLSPRLEKVLAAGSMPGGLFIAA